MAPLEPPAPALPQGPQPLRSHGSSTWGPPRPRDGISLSLATTNTAPGQPASSLCLLLSPWRPQCHRGGSLAKATTVTQHPPGPQLPPRGHHQHCRAVTATATASPLGAATSPSRDQQLRPAAASSCRTALPDEIPDPGQAPTDPAPRLSSQPLSLPLPTMERLPPLLREERRPRKPVPTPAAPSDAPAPPLRYKRPGQGAGVRLPPTHHREPVPAPRKACHSAGCLADRPRGREAGEKQVGAPIAGVRGGGVLPGKTGRDQQATGLATPQLTRPGHVSQAHTQPHARTQSEGPCPYRCLRAKGALRPTRLYPWPGLREAPAAAAPGGSSRSNGVPGPGPAQAAAASHPGPLLLRGSKRGGERGGGRGEEERRRGRGAAGGREEGEC